jgi:hypothetical protein
VVVRGSFAHDIHTSHVICSVTCQAWGERLRIDAEVGPAPQLHGDLARRPCRIYRATAGLRSGPMCTGSGASSPQRHVRQDWSRANDICTGTRPTPATPAAGTGPTPATSDPGLGPPLPYLTRDWACSCLAQQAEPPPTASDTSFDSRYPTPRYAVRPASDSRQSDSDVTDEAEVRPAAMTGFFRTRGAGRAPATSAPGLSSALPHLHRDRSAGVAAAEP